MKRYLILHQGFEPPSPEEMAGWNRWFEEIADRQVERGGLGDGREITKSEVRELPFGADSVTGFTVIEAESLDEAETLARGCPIVGSTRVYEIRTG